MAAKRIFAVVAAIVLIVGAIFARRAIDDDDTPAATGSSAPGASAPAPTAAAGGPMRLTCIADLRTECQRYAAQHPDDVVITIENVNATVKRLTAGTFDSDGWITMQPFQQYAPATWNATPVAESTIVVAAKTAQPLATCTGTVKWSCIVGLATTDIVAHRDPRTTAEGSLALGALAVGAMSDTADFDQATFDDNIAASNTIRALEQKIQKGSFTELSVFQMLATRNKFGVAVGSEASLRSGGFATTFTVRAPNPIVKARVIWVAPGERSGLDALQRDLLRLLQEASWSQANTDELSLPSASTLTALPAKAGLKVD